MSNYSKVSTKNDPRTELHDQLGLTGECYATVPEAVRAATDAATPDDFIFVGGSTYVVADFTSTI